MRGAGRRVELNARGDKIGAKIRDAQRQKVPFMLVLGDREAEGEAVAVRERSRDDLASCRSRSLSRWRSDSSGRAR
jgi:threonyl-tRNA synthetase